MLSMFAKLQFVYFCCQLQLILLVVSSQKFVQSRSC